MVSECFVDTNVLLHFHPFDQIDWKGLTAADSVVLTVSAAVISELDGKKIYGHSARLRQRARDALRRLDSWRADAGRIKEGVTLRLIAKEPNIDWEKYELDRHVNDDRIVAAVLTQGLPSTDKWLTSNDFGLRLKADAHGLKVLVLPDEARQPELAGETEREAVNLRQRLAVLENKEPKMALLFDTEDGYSERLQISLRPSAVLGVDEIERLIALRSGKLNENLEGAATLRALGTLLTPAPSEIERYERAIPQHLEMYREYLGDRDLYDREQSLTFELPLVVLNSGYAPAEGVKIWMHVPDGPSVFEEEDIPAPPSEPTEPPGPRSALQLNISNSIPDFHYPFTEHLRLGSHTDLIRNLPVGGIIRSGPQIRRTNSYEIEYERGSILHGEPEVLDRLFCSLASIREAKSFEIDYRIRARNLAVPSEGVLRVLVSLSVR